MAASSKGWACGRPLAVTTASIPAEDTDICLLRKVCAAADPSSRGVLTSVFVSLNVVTCNSDPLSLQSRDRKMSSLMIKESVNRTYLYFAFYDFHSPCSCYYYLMHIGLCIYMYWFNRQCKFCTCRKLPLVHASKHHVSKVYGAGNGGKLPRNL